MIRVRFAASPVGPLFVSGARVALANHLFARRGDGRLLLRLDDLDQERSSPAHVMQMMQDLRWFGIEWDDCAQQSERLELYLEAISRLKQRGLMYPCFESEAELRAKREFRRKRNQSTVYDREMLSLTARQRDAAEAGGKRPHWRLRLSGRVIEWRDMIAGDRRTALTSVSDPVLVRADGRPMPILASVVDDIAFSTTHIIRGEGNAGHTAIQIELFETLTGAPAMIRFAHLPPLADAAEPAPAGVAGRRIGSLSLRGLRNDGVEPIAIAACLANCEADQAEPPALNDLAARFDLKAFAGCGFDPTRLLAINRGVLRRMGFAAVADRLPGGATEAFWLAVRGSLDLLKEVRGWWDVVGGTIVPPVVENEYGLLATAEAVLPPEPWDGSVWTRWIAALEQATGRVGEDLLPPLRLALTGEDTGPDLADLLPLIGRSRAASRLHIAVA
ncbi:glutamate--tRNA ligase [Rhodopila sp.]|uniref:glutamate--tRNA ligase n=1 Tax=Rhodopila sp. TaxID=2480087 RepID=UPI003D09AD38